MLKLINTVAIVLTVGLGAGPAMAQTAGPGGQGGNTGAGGSEPYTHVPRQPDRRKKIRHDGDCGYVEALASAARMGIQGGVIADSRIRSMTVAGSNGGHFVFVRFARAPGCPVMGRW